MSSITCKWRGGEARGEGSACFGRSARHGCREENFEDTVRLVKEFIFDVWEVRKQKLYGEDTCPSHNQCQTLAGDAGPVTGGGELRASTMGRLQENGKLGKFHVCSGNVHASDCGSAH